MKTMFLVLAISLISCEAKSKAKVIAEAVSYQKQIANIQADSLLMGIEKKISQAFVQGMLSGKKEALEKISSELDALYREKKQNLIRYWQAYLQYYLAVFYIKQDDRKNSEKEIDKAVGMMKNIKKKNSEDYALLALLESFAIQFKGIKAMFISRRIKENAKMAIAIDSTNLRAYFVLGSNDFYTPEKYGGGKEAEKYLLKAISLPSQKIKNPYLPSWGKEEAYELLVRYYIKKEKWKDAKNLLKEGIRAFPQSYQWNQLATKLIDK